MLVSVVMVYISIEIHVRYVEEPYLHMVHKESFKQYTQKVGRYLPRVKYANR